MQYYRRMSLLYLKMPWVLGHACVHTAMLCEPTIVHSDVLNYELTLTHAHYVKFTNTTTVVSGGMLGAKKWVGFVLWRSWISVKFHGNPFPSCGDISVWIKVADWPTDRLTDWHWHPLSHTTCVAENIACVGFCEWSCIDFHFWQTRILSVVN